MKKLAMLAAPVLLLVVACAPTPDGRQLLRDCQEALLRASTVRYAYTASGGDPASRLEGRALIERLDDSGSAYRMRIDTRAQRDEVWEEIQAARGLDLVQVASDRDRTMRVGSLHSLGPSLQVVVEPALMYPFFDPVSLDGEIEAREVVWEGVSEVAGIPCDLVRVSYEDDPEDSRWCLGRADHLPRRLEWIGEEGSTVLEIRDVESGVSVATTDFVLALPEGYASVEPSYGPPPGTVAREWTLATPEGDRVSLADLRGQVVVLEFWATWCAPCREALAGLEKLTREWEGLPVRAFAVNSLESGDPLQAFKDLGIDVPLLLEGDEIHRDYAKGSLPAVVVLDREGRHYGVGLGYLGEGSREYLRTLVAGALAEGD